MLLIEDRLDAAGAHLSQGRDDSAALIYESILDISPGNVKALAELASIRLGKGDLKGASVLAAEAAERAASDPGILCLLARVTLLTEEEDRASAALDQALSVAPFHPEACQIKAGILVQQGDPRTAERLLRDALDRHPSDAGLLASLSEMYMVHGLTAPALELGQRALDLDSSRPELVALVGMQLAALGDHEKALGLLERAHLLDPGNALYMVHLADSQCALGQLTEALRVARRAVTLFPNLLSAWTSYAKVMIYRGEAERAFAEFVPAARRHPDKLAALLALASAYRIAGDPAQALRLVEAIAGQTGSLKPIQKAHAAALMRDCYLSLGQFDKVAATFRDTALGAALAPSAGPQPEQADAEPSPGADMETTPENAIDAERRDALLNGASLVVDKGLSNLEALTLLRFRPKRAEADDPVDVYGPAGLAQLVELMDHVRFRHADRPGEGRPGGGRQDAVEAVPLSLILALPQEFPGGIDGPGMDGPGIDSPVPYMRAPQGRQELWQRSLSHLPRPLIALAWDATRPGILLDDYRPVFERFEGTLVSVMWDDSRHQLAAWPEIIDAGVHFSSLADLAAVIAEADATIGPDGIPLHVAGAMGRPGLLLSFPGIPWYWHSNEGKAAWYPSVSVLRTRAFGNWASKLPELAPDIQQFLDDLGTHTALAPADDAPFQAVMGGN